MDINKLEETIAGIALLKELGLPVNLEQLQNLRKQEAKYISENVVPQTQSLIQTLVEKIHIPFSLVVEYQYGSPVQVRIVEKTGSKESAKRYSQDNAIPRTKITKNPYSSAHIQTAWKKFLKSLPNGDIMFKVTISQPYHSISKLLRVMQSKDMLRYTSSLFELLNLPATGNISPTDFKNMLEPEQFVQETTEDGTFNRIVLWTQVQKTEVLKDGTRMKSFEADGITPIMIDKAKSVKEGQWTLKTLCDLMVQKKYFAQKRIEMHENKRYSEY